MGASFGVSDMPDTVMCQCLSFVLTDNGCCNWMRGVSRHFAHLVNEPLSWLGTSVRLSTSDLGDATMSSGSTSGAPTPPFKALVPLWKFCTRIELDFVDAHKRRDAAKQCFLELAQSCVRITSLCLKGWYRAQNDALCTLSTSFLSLQHLDFSGCDQISAYEEMLPVFRAHPGLISLRASFHPRATAGSNFARAAPTSLKALGFVRFDAPESLTILLERCPLEHLWLEATGPFPAPIASALSMSPAAARLQTLSLPAEALEKQCFEVSETCPQLSLLCRMRIGTPAFGTAELASLFEVLPDGQGVVLRRRGSKLELAQNGALWAPSHTQGRKH